MAGVSSLACANSLSAVSRSYLLVQPEAPVVSPGVTAARSHSFGSMQGVRVRCGLVGVDRRSAPNERQRALLERLAMGEEDVGAWAPGDWRSAYALRDRGLLRVSRGGGKVFAEVTEAGRSYLHHGRHSDAPALAEGGESSGASGPRTPYSERPVARARRAKVRELVERLVTEGRVRFADADDDEIVEWRRVVNYAKRHGLEPEGKRIEKVPYGGVGWSSSSRRASIPMRGASGRRMAYRTFRFPCGWHPFIRLWLRSGTMRCDW